uniref:Uncharacterized protein n=1 Tax=Alexandrium catenella TaxID=2925 RepID=A0A7S1WLB1_ALECA
MVPAGGMRLASPWLCGVQAMPVPVAVPTAHAGPPLVYMPSAAAPAQMAGARTAWMQGGGQAAAWVPVARPSSSPSWALPVQHVQPAQPAPVIRQMPMAASYAPPLPVVKDFGAAPVPVIKDTRQESDLLDEIKPGENLCDELTNSVRLVSLGCYCGPKLSFQQIGRGAETLPFDWIRTRPEGLLHYLRSGFAGFYDFVTQEPVPGASSMVMYRDYLHSFWHDDPTDVHMRERYDRRIRRLQSINAEQQPVLFVRSIGSLEELQYVPELLSELSSRFGRRSLLMLIVDFQDKKTHGPLVVRGHPNLLLYYFCRELHDTSGLGPYDDAVRCGLEWAVGRDVGAAVYPSLEAAAAAATPMDFGGNGLGGLRAFEDTPDPRLLALMRAALGGPGLMPRAAAAGPAAPGQWARAC